MNTFTRTTAYAVVRIDQDRPIIAVVSKANEGHKIGILQECIIRKESSYRDTREAIGYGGVLVISFEDGMQTLSGFLDEFNNHKDISGFKVSTRGLVKKPVNRLVKDSICDSNRLILEYNETNYNSVKRAFYESKLYHNKKENSNN
jgi:hypothetical protein